MQHCRSRELTGWCSMQPATCFTIQRHSCAWWCSHLCEGTFNILLMRCMHVSRLLSTSTWHQPA
jgi:hypothetical protein